MHSLVDNVIDAAVVVAVAYVFYAAATEPVDPPPALEPLAAVSTTCEDDRAACLESSPHAAMPPARHAAYLFLSSERDEP
jgi:hypothetical protein